MSKWISVDERLPEEGDIIVSAHFYDNGLMPDAAVCWLLNGKFHFYEDGTCSEENIYLDMVVTHWMPIPEPPKENDK